MGGFPTLEKAVNQCLSAILVISHSLTILDKCLHGESGERCITRQPPLSPMWGAPNKDENLKYADALCNFSHLDETRRKAG
jgi:hypothetical protein